MKGRGRGSDEGEWERRGRQPGVQVRALPISHHPLPPCGCCCSMIPSAPPRPFRAAQGRPAAPAFGLEAEEPAQGEEGGAWVDMSVTAFGAPWVWQL